MSAQVIHMKKRLKILPIIVSGMLIIVLMSAIYFVLQNPKNQATGIISSFTVALVALIFGQQIWNWIQSPKIFISRKLGPHIPHPINKNVYYKLKVENRGMTAARNAIALFVTDDPRFREKHYTLKWDSSPEPKMQDTIFRYVEHDGIVEKTLFGGIDKTTEFLFDAYQKIDLYPGVPELIPLVVMVGEKLFLFGNWQWFQNLRHDIHIGRAWGKGELNGKVIIAFHQDVCEIPVTIRCNFGDPKSEHPIEFHDNELLC